MISQELNNFLIENGYREIREIPGRGICALMPFIFTIGLVYGIDEIGYVGRYCYDRSKAEEAVVAIVTWDGIGNPSGNWIKHKSGTGEFNNKAS